MLAQEDRTAVATVGLAIVRAVLAHHLRQHRTGTQDAGQLAARGLKPSSDEWRELEAIAKEAHLADLLATDEERRTDRAETKD